MARLPSIFVSHGAPTLALRPRQVGPALRQVALAFPAPKAILVVSPHWVTAQSVVSAAPRMATIHDFGPFDPALFDLRYEPDPARPDDDLTQPYVESFRSWMVERLSASDAEALLDYRRRAPHAARAHPTEEHHAIAS